MRRVRGKFCLQKAVGRLCEGHEGCGGCGEAVGREWEGLWGEVMGRLWGSHRELMMVHERALGSHGPSRSPLGGTTAISGQLCREEEHRQDGDKCGTQ